MATDKEYWEKRASDEERMARLQENMKAIEDAIANHEKEREQSMRYYDKQRDAEMWDQMIEKAKLDTKPLTPELQQEIVADCTQWLDDQRRALDAYRTSDGTKEIAPGTMSTFDKKAAEIVEKGNVYTSLPFLNQARQLAAEKYAAFENKQAAYDLEIERNTVNGDLMAAQVLEARKTYEAAAYERDTAQSVLAKYEVLYGVESKNYKEQAADVEKLTGQADDLYQKLEAVTSADADLRKVLEAETLVEQQEQAAEAQSSMMDRLHDRIVDAKEDEAFEQGWEEFQSRDMEPPTTEADDAEARADEILRAMDEGRNPYSDGYDDFEAQEAAAEDALEREMSGEIVDEIDPDGDAQIAEDRHLAAEMPHDLEFEAPEEEYDQEHEMAPVHRYEDRDSEKSQAPSESPASLTQEFSDSDRQRLDEMMERSNMAMENMAKASDSGDDRSLHVARSELAAANGEFQDYLADRREFKTAMTDFGNAAERLSKNGSEIDSAEARRFERSYREANSAIDRMEADGKPWAGEMRQHLRAVGETHVEKEKAAQDKDAPQKSTLSSVMQKSDTDREAAHEIRVVQYTPPPVQTQQDQDKDRLVQH